MRWIALLVLVGCSSSSNAGHVLRMPGVTPPPVAECLPSGDLCTDSAYCCARTECITYDDSGTGMCEAN